MTVPKLSSGVRFRRGDDGQGMLLVPEGMVSLNPPAAAVVELVDGLRSTDAIANTLSTEYGVDKDVMTRDVETLVSQLAAKMWLALDACANEEPPKEV